MATATKHSAIKDPSNNAVRVEIFDQAYNLRGSDPEYILKLAEYVDGKMRAVAEQTHTVDTARLAVLAALNIADEYHLVKRSQDSGLGRLSAAGATSFERARRSAGRKTPGRIASSSGALTFCSSWLLRSLLPRNLPSAVNRTWSSCLPWCVTLPAM